METRIQTAQRTNLCLALALAAGLILASGAVLAEETSRVSKTTQMSRADRDDGLAGTVSESTFAPMVMTGSRDKPAMSGAQGKAGLSAAQSPNTDFWFYSADVLLFNDHDNDGYFHGIDLLFDADTYFLAADVYAVVYLSYEGGPWNEYATTEPFTLNGTSADDEYVIVTELLTGYPSGSYDLLIELFDAYDGSFLAWYGPEDTPALAFLSLEDADRDRPVAEGPDVILVHEHGGGAASWALLAVLAAAAISRRRLQRPAACCRSSGPSRRAVRMTLRPQAARLSK